MSSTDDVVQKLGDRADQIAEAFQKIAPKVFDATVRAEVITNAVQLAVLILFTFGACCAVAWAVKSNDCGKEERECRIGLSLLALAFFMFCLGVGGSQCIAALVAPESAAALKLIEALKP